MVTEQVVYACIIEERIVYHHHMLHYPNSQVPEKRKRRRAWFSLFHVIGSFPTHMLDVMIHKIRIPPDLHNSMLLYWP